MTSKVRLTLLRLLLALFCFAAVVKAQSESTTTTTTTNCGYFDLSRACPGGCWAIFQDYNKTTEMVECRAVTKLGYFSLEGSTLLRPCSPGTFANQSGSAECAPCLPGTFADENGTTDCKPCLSGTYQDETGQEKCKSCSSFYYNGTGANAAVVDGEGDLYCQLDQDYVTPSMSPNAPALEKTILMDQMPSLSPTSKPTTQVSVSVVTVMVPSLNDDEPWKAPFAMAIASFAGVFVLFLFSIFYSARSSDKNNQYNNAYPPMSPRLVQLAMQSQQHSCRSLDIFPVQQLPDIHGDFEQPRNNYDRRHRRRFTPQPFRVNADNNVPEAAAGGAMVTPYYTPYPRGNRQNSYHPAAEEEKICDIPDASFESFARCYEDPEIASGFANTSITTEAIDQGYKAKQNSSDMAVVSRATNVHLSLDRDEKVPVDGNIGGGRPEIAEEESMWEGPFDMASDETSEASNDIRTQDMLPNAPDINEMSPMSGSFDWP